MAENSAIDPGKPLADPAGSRPSPKSRRAAVIGDSTDLVKARLRCLELAIENQSRSTHNEVILAGIYAEFVIDGLIAVDSVSGAHG